MVGCDHVFKFLIKCLFAWMVDGTYIASLAGRLEDKSSIVRRAALQLLMALLLYNPFGAQLPEACFAASLAEYKAKLQVRCSSVWYLKLAS